MRWAGIMGVGKTKKPIVKKLSENVSCGVRMGGMGVATVLALFPVVVAGHFVSCLWCVLCLAWSWYLTQTLNHTHAGRKNKVCVCVIERGEGWPQAAATRRLGQSWLWAPCPSRS